jgi:cytochrome c nitrite reductase small subunit
MLKQLFPPPAWHLPVIILLGIFTGLGILTLYLAKAHSYLSDRPETCVNCHIMAPQYATWQHSAHREYTNCNDCHVPHNNIATKTKAQEFIGLDMKKFREEKAAFLREMVPAWKSAGEKRQAAWQ